MAKWAHDIIAVELFMTLFITASSLSASVFHHHLSSARLGQAHDSMASYQAAISSLLLTQPPTHEKHYTLIVVTETHRRRILLGRKHRGFGTGFFNSFGGKVEDSDPCLVSSACRELHEETNIQIDVQVMRESRVGTLEFLMADSPVKMVVHVFRVHVTTEPDDLTQESSLSSSKTCFPRYTYVDPTSIRGCEEITPQWFDNWHDMPLQEMFADDSVWLTHLLSESETTPDLKLYGWFHFAAGGTDTNTILHRYVETSCSGKETVLNESTPERKSTSPQLVEE